jgi:hypothetical protein
MQGCFVYADIEMDSKSRGWGKVLSAETLSRERKSYSMDKYN